jgi:quinol-cytochrome oxidoreductase complex cytochrome b subunit
MVRLATSSFSFGFLVLDFFRDWVTELSTLAMEEAKPWNQSSKLSRLTRPGENWAIGFHWLVVVNFMGLGVCGYQIHLHGERGSGFHADWVRKYRWMLW